MTVSFDSITQAELKVVLARILFLEGCKAGDEITIEAHEITFGRSRLADLHLDDPQLSRLHAKITRRGMGFRLIDLGSRHGTFANGIRILEHPLNSFDLIEMGGCKFRFVIQDLSTSALNAKQPNLVPVPDTDTKSMVVTLNAPPTKWQPRSAMGGALLFAGAMLFGLSYLGLRPASPTPSQLGDFPPIGQIVHYEPVPSIVNPRVEKLVEKVKNDGIDDVPLLLMDGVDSLALGDFDAAAENFHAVLSIVPNEKTATAGLKAVDLKIKSLRDLPADPDPIGEKRRLVADLLLQSAEALKKGHYQFTVEMAQKARKISLEGETEYLDIAQQLVDRARAGQREEFEPFLINAREKLAIQDYSASRDLLEEMLKKDPDYSQVKDILRVVREELTELARDAYSRAYISESLSQFADAKRYLLLAQNYVRPGDPYFDRIQKRLRSLP